MNDKRADGLGDLPAFVHPADEGAIEVQAMYDADREQYGYVMNATRVWSHAVGTKNGLFELLGQVVRTAGLSMRDRGILVASCAAQLGDAYCSLAWGTKLAEETDADLAAAVLLGQLEGLTPKERELARWARAITEDPNATTAAHVHALREVGYDDTQIVAITAFVGLRIAFSTVNDALGARPDTELGERAPEPVSAAVDFGRATAAACSEPHHD